MRSRLATVLLALLFAARAAGASEHPAPAGPPPDAVLKELAEGNARFVSGKSTAPRTGKERRQETAKGQHPKAIVLGCSDSRVPPEYAFDQGIGDLFVVRVAGNVAEEHTLGSIEYAAEHLGVPLLIVLGHHDCGAVHAAASGAAAPGNVGALVKEILPAVASVKQPGPEGLVHDAVHAHARAVARSASERSPVLAKLQREGKLRIAVAVYDLASGKVDFEK